LRFRANKTICKFLESESKSIAQEAATTTTVPSNRIPPTTTTITEKGKKQPEKNLTKDLMIHKNVIIKKRKSLLFLVRC
jgi:hypothetical protein